MFSFIYVHCQLYFYLRAFSYKNILYFEQISLFSIFISLILLIFLCLCWITLLFFFQFCEIKAHIVGSRAFFLLNSTQLLLGHFLQGVHGVRGMFVWLAVFQIGNASSKAWWWWEHPHGEPFRPLGGGSCSENVGSKMRTGGYHWWGYLVLVPFFCLLIHGNSEASTFLHCASSPQYLCLAVGLKVMVPADWSLIIHLPPPTSPSEVLCPNYRKRL